MKNVVNRSRQRKSKPISSAEEIEWDVLVSEAPPADTPLLDAVLMIYRNQKSHPSPNPHENQ